MRIDHVRVFVAPWFFRLPWFRRFDGHAFHFGMLLRSDTASDDLIAHELCHVWQMQHRPVRMPLSYLVRGYWNNPYEVQARAAAAATGTVPAGDSPPDTATAA